MAALRLAATQLGAQLGGAEEEEEESEEEFVEPEDPEGHTLAERDAHGLKPQGPTSSLAADTPLTVAGDAIGEGQEEFDLSQTVRVRTLYPYAGQRDEDLGFHENAIVIAHPAKDDGNDWMYGTLLTGGSGKKGTFPKAYVAPLTSGEFDFECRASSMKIHRLIR